MDSITKCDISYDVNSLPSLHFKMHSGAIFDDDQINKNKINQIRSVLYTFAFLSGLCFMGEIEVLS